MDNEQVLRQEQDSYFYWVKIRPVISLGVGNYFDFCHFLNRIVMHGGFLKQRWGLLRPKAHHSIPISNLFCVYFPDRLSKHM